MYEPTQKQLDYFEVKQTGSMELKYAYGLHLTKKFRVRMTWREALELSIAKWISMHRWLLRHRKAWHVANGACDTCALCIKHGEVMEGEEGKECYRCPVSKSTRLDECDGTPYKGYIRSRTRTQSLRAIREEVKFLQGLHERLHGGG